MKKTLCLLVFLFCLFGIIGITNAALVSYDEDTILDDVTGKLWWKDLSDFTYMTYDEQITTIGNLGGNWHMADNDEMAALFNYGYSHIGGAFTKTGVSHTNVSYWMGRWNGVAPSTTGDAHYVARVTFNPAFSGQWDGYFGYGMWTSDGTSGYLTGAWVTSDSPVPIPGAVLLLGSGLIGLVGLRRKFKK